MNLFTQLNLPRYSKLEFTVDYLSVDGRKRWTFFVQYNVHRYFNSLDQFYDYFLSIAPEDFENPISIKFEVFYDF